MLIAKASDALAHPARVRIFRHIYNANRQRMRICNKDLVQAFEYSQATISQHLKKLIFSDLVHVQKESNFSFYYVNIGVLGRYLDAIKKLQ